MLETPAPGVYRHLLGGSDSDPACSPECCVLVEELADLSYQLLKLHGVHTGAIVRVDLVQTDCTLEGAPLAMVRDAARAMIQEGAASTFSAVLERFGSADQARGLAHTFLEVQCVSQLARRLRGESRDGWQDEQWLRGKVLEEYGEVAQALAPFVASGPWLGQLAHPLAHALSYPSLESVVAFLAEGERCARALVGARVSLHGMVELMNLKLLGRAEWNLEGHTVAEVKSGLKEAESLLVRALVSRRPSP